MLKTLTGAALLFSFAATGAAAQELDALLPEGIPGYGTPFAVVADHKVEAPQPTGGQWGAFSLVPALAGSGGYDSAPGGAGASSVFTVAPSLLVTDRVLGFGAYAAATKAVYPQDGAQNTGGVTLAMGEQVALPGETVTLAAGYLNAQETGFALDTVAISRPVAFTLENLRASDEIVSGPFTLKPEVAVLRYRFPGLAAQDRTETREGVTAVWSPPGPVQVLLRVAGTQSADAIPDFSTRTQKVLVGLVDTADGLWTFSALVGVARRQGERAPVLEMRLDWMPAELDRVRLEVVREIDDPDEVGAVAYMLDQAKISVSHEVQTDVTAKFSAQVGEAAYFDSGERETLVGTDAALSWQLGAHLAVEGAYAFNDRQANYLPAANEHVVTLGMTWTP